MLAAVVRLLERTLIRVGNEEYARTNKSFGLTTMRDGHVRISGSKVRFIFRGKSGIDHELELDDRRLATIVKQCRDLPGQELFQYRDQDDRVIDVSSDDVNAYLKEITGEDFTSKDFRTWAGTVLAARSAARGRCRHASLRPGSVSSGGRGGGEAAGQHEGRLPKVLHPSGGDRRVSGWCDGKERRAGAPRAPIGKLTQAEAAVLALLQRRMARTAS